MTIIPIRRIYKTGYNVTFISLMFYTKNSIIKAHFTYKTKTISICNYLFNNVTFIDPLAVFVE